MPSCLSHYALKVLQLQLKQKRSSFVLHLMMLPLDVQALRKICLPDNVCCCNDPLATCPVCTTPLECSATCENASCPAYPDAICLMDYCSTCEPRIFLGKDEVTFSSMEPQGCQGKVYDGLALMMIVCLWNCDY